MSDSTLLILNIFIFSANFDSGSCFRESCDIVRYYGDNDAPVINAQTGCVFLEFVNVDKSLPLRLVAEDGGSAVVETILTESLWLQVDLQNAILTSKFHRCRIASFP